MKLTGERPMEGQTPDSLLALHDAGYREVLIRLGTGRVLDVGCGLGTETARLRGPSRRVVGVDYDPDTAASARTRFGTDPADATFAAMDGAALGFRPGSFDAICSSHVIEHFAMPERHVAELARACADDGVVFVLTPNRPADFENPFHVYLVEADELRSLLRLFFDDVEVIGLEGDETLQADFRARRARGDKLLRLDVLELRKRLPRRTYVWVYERVLPVVYRAMGPKASGIGSGLDEGHLFTTTDVRPTTPVLFAIARRPRRFPPR